MIIFTDRIQKKELHEQAHELLLTIETTPSRRVAKLMQEDLEELLAEHGCKVEGES